MDKLSTTELAAMTAYMAAEGLSQSSLSRKLGINQSSVFKWMNGGGVSPSGRAALLKLITPYLKPDQFVDADKMVPAEIRPSLRRVYGELCKLEDASAAAVEVVTIQIAALALQWPGVVARRNAPTITERIEAEAAVVKESLIARPKTTPPELRIVRPLDDLPMLEAAAGTGREGAAFAMNAGKAQVIGESMEPEYQHGEIVKLEPLAEVVMMNDEGFIDFAAVAKVIKSGGDYLLSLNDSGNTIKRIRLETPGPSGRWALNLVALNRDWADANGYDKGERMIRRGDSLVIYARVRR